MRTCKINAMFAFVLTSFLPSYEVSAKAGKFSAKTGRFLARAEKFPEKFDVFCSGLYVLEPALDVNASLQVEPGDRHDARTFGSDLHGRDHVKLLVLRITFRF